MYDEFLEIFNFCLSVFDHFVNFALKVLSVFAKKYILHI